jgi:HEAT repeat protein
VRDRRAVPDVLVQCDHFTDVTIEALVMALDDADENVRRSAENALTDFRVRKAAPRIMPHLIKAFWNGSERLSRAAAVTPAQIDAQAPSGNQQVIPLLTTVPRHKWHDERSPYPTPGYWAATALGRYNTAACDAIIPLLSEMDHYDLIEAAHALELLGPDAAAAVPSLIEAGIRDTVAEIRVMDALICIGHATLAAPATSPLQPSSLT